MKRCFRMKPHEGNSNIKNLSNKTADCDSAQSPQDSCCSEVIWCYGSSTVIGSCLGLQTFIIPSNLPITLQKNVCRVVMQMKHLACVTDWLCERKDFIMMLCSCHHAFRRTSLRKCVRDCLVSNSEWQSISSQTESTNCLFTDMSHLCNDFLEYPTLFQITCMAGDSFFKVGLWSNRRQITSNKTHVHREISMPDLQGFT